MTAWYFSYQFMMVFRFMACALMWALLIFTVCIDQKYYGRPQAAYFSQFGIYMTTILFTLLVISHLKTSSFQTVDYDNPSPWRLWKWCNFLLPMNFHWQFLTTTLYWLVIYWQIRPTLILQPTSIQIEYYLGHSLPGLLVTSDMWLLNSTTFTYSHSYAIVGFYIAFFTGLSIFISNFGNEFFGVESETEFNVWTVFNLILYAIVTYFILYNINYYLKISMIQTKEVHYDPAETLDRETEEEEIPFLE